MSRSARLALGLAAALLLGWLYHGPLGTGARFRQDIESTARSVLVHYEMGMIDSRLAGPPLRRTLLLSGPADDFQRSELVRMLGDIPGVGAVRWVGARAPGGGGGLPLLAEVELLALAAFGLGLLLAKLVDWRRRWRE